MKKQEKAAFIASCANLLITLLKFFLAAITGSLALLAEAFHSFSDVFSSFLVFWAIRRDRSVASEPASSQDASWKPKLFRTGMWESKAAMALGVLLLIAGLRILSEVKSPSTTGLKVPMVAACCMFFAAFVSYLLSRFEIDVAKETESPGLLADGYHARVDCLTTSLVGISLISERIGLRLDRPAAAVIALIVLITGLKVLGKAVQGYWTGRKTQAVAETLIFEDVFVHAIALAVEWLRRLNNALIAQLPGYKKDPAKAVRCATLTLASLAIGVLIGGYFISGIFIVRPGQRAIVERMGKPLNLSKPLDPGLHASWPWPIGRVWIVLCEGVRSETVGYQSLPGQGMILWTNVHYQEPYTVLTGENSFCEVAMSLHYALKPCELADYLYQSKSPDQTLLAISHKTLREAMGIKEFFSAITTDRDAMEESLKERIQSQSDQIRLGIKVTNICLRDIHPSVDVAPSFEDVVSAMEDLETSVEEARGYERSLIPRAEGEANTNLLKADADRISAVAKAQGVSEAFILQRVAFDETKDITEYRLKLDLWKDVLPPLTKLVVSSRKGKARPEIWTGFKGGFPPAATLEPALTPNQEPQRSGRFNATTEEDLLDLVEKYRMKENTR